VKGRSRFLPALIVITLFAAVVEFQRRYEPSALEEAGWLIGDGVDYRDMTRSLLAFGSLDYRLVNPREAARYTEGGRYTRTAARSNVSLTDDGRLVPKHSALFALAIALPYAVAREPGLLLFNWAQSILLVLLVYWLSARYVPPDVAFVAATIFLADGILRNYTYNVSPDVFGAVLVLGGTVLVWHARPSRRRLLAGGTVLGLAVWLRPLNLVGLAALLPAAVVGLRARRLDSSFAWPLAGFAAGVSGYLLLNVYWFENPFTTSYDRVLVLTDGVRSIASHRSDLNRPFWSSLLPTLGAGEHGFLQTAPHWPLILPALIYLGRRRFFEALALGALIFGPALFLVKYDYWDLSHFGNRFLILPAAASALGIAWLIRALMLGRPDSLDPLSPDTSSPGAHNTTSEPDDSYRTTASLAASEALAVEETSLATESPGVPASEGSLANKPAGRPRMTAGVTIAILSALAPIVLLLWNTQIRTRGADFRTLSGDWARAWDDVAIASGFVQYGVFPVAPYLATNGFSRTGQVAFDEFKKTFSGLERTHAVRLSQPLQGFDAVDLFPRRPRVAQRFDDVGRAYLLGLGFRAIGKVAPGMLFWLAPVIAALVLIWIVVEAFRAGLPIFGIGLSLLVAVSSFCIDMFVLGYSATGFYLISILLCLAYGLGVIGRTTTVWGLMARSALTGAVLGVCVNARSVSITVLPALLIVALVGGRLMPAAGGRRTGAVLASVVLLIAPIFLLRGHLAESSRMAADRFGGDAAPGSHDVWITYWQGLGDFDRTHGHVFLDQAGLAVLREHGGKERVSERSEAIMRRLVIESIQSDPVWFAGILLQRAALSLSFHKLWPMASATSPGFYPSSTANEGVTDSYWAMADQADVFRIGASRIEVPSILFPLLLAAFFWLGSRRSEANHGCRRPHLVDIVGVSGLSALVGPVVATTAGAFEPQAFVLVVFAATAGLLQIAAWRVSDLGRRQRVVVRFPLHVTEPPLPGPPEGDRE
jgi:hypothetical protein